MGAWLVDRVLPGIVSSAAVIGVSHLMLRRHITRIAGRASGVDLAVRRHPAGKARDG